MQHDLIIFFKIFDAAFMTDSIGHLFFGSSECMQFHVECNTERDTRWLRRDHLEIVSERARSGLGVRYSLGSIHIDRDLDVAGHLCCGCYRLVCLSPKETRY
jgi:hypothetical protein